MDKMLEKIFKIAAHGSTPRREVMAGATTFLTMAYIIFVNPEILSMAGMEKGALITATCLAAAFGTLLVGLWANVPFAMAPGMGLNALFTFTLVKTQGLSWQTALGVVFFSGVIFLILTVVGFRQRVVDAIPMSIRLAVAAGIGLFLTIIGFENLGLVVDHPVTLVTIGEITRPVLLGLIGLVIMAVLHVRKIPGAILLGILVVTVLGFITGDVALPKEVISAPPSLSSIAFQLDLRGALTWGLFGAIFSFMFVDLFDSVGTIVACSYEAGLVNEEGGIEKIDKVLEADAIATVAGSLMGTSTTTTYIESGSGISAGGRTGLTAVTVAGFFLLALIFTPLVGVVPKFATAPALIMVGIFMFKNVSRIDFSDFETAVPAFLTMVLMPLTYSISIGLIFGFLSYIIITVASGDILKIRPVMWLIGLLSLTNLLVQAGII
ncbi:guanine permease [bacterium M21]|nr:guanine permease [bacterium M21]